MSDWTIENLGIWNEKIETLAVDMGLDFYPQEFEMCDYRDMLGYQSYAGMPARYPHWSFGKAFELQRTMYSHGVSGLSYEMVINSNPCLAYLMIDNPLSLQILTMAHVYGHNDFFKNNIHFSKTRAELALEMFKRHADRVRTYVETPGIGASKVEKILDAAHAIKFQCQRNIFIKTISEDEQKSRYFEKLNQQGGDWSHLSNDRGNDEEDFIFDPEKDLLLFIRDNQRFLEDWEKDLLTIVHNETQYFLPQMETKIMNEGWASFWHYTLLNRLDLPTSIQMDFIRSHNQVVRPHVGGLNPYNIGYMMFSKLSGSDGHEIDNKIDPEIFDIRHLERDSSFLRRYLTQEMAQELHLFEYQQANGKTVISEVSNEEGWGKVKETLIANIGINSIPMIEAKEITNNNELVLNHVFDQRELELKYTEKTMKYIYDLWSYSVLLETTIDGEPVVWKYNENGFSVQ